MAIFQIYKMLAVRHIGMLTVCMVQGAYLVTVPNFICIGQSVLEI